MWIPAYAGMTKRRMKKIKLWIIERYDALNNFIYHGQQVIGGVYDRYFTLHASLIAALITGGFLGLTGENCYGKIPLDSPVFWTLLLAAFFFFFQTFVLIQLTIGRMVRLFTVAICGHYLFYQGYGLWSQANVELVEAKITSQPYSKIMLAMNDATLVANINGVGVCKPFALANTLYGHAWITVPAMLLVLICFFVGNAKKELDNS
jgi:hypothetical protein